jgi:hypothetical protein
LPGLEEKDFEKNEVICKGKIKIITLIEPSGSCSNIEKARVGGSSEELMCFGIVLVYG